MNWFFPSNQGGRDSGFHDAGVETFKGNFDRYLARELIQNSLDARFSPETPVHVRFKLLDLTRDQVPAMDQLQETFERCAEYWDDHERACSFFRTATQLVAGTKLTALVVSDFNTTGVPGQDDGRRQNWYHLVRCAGSSSKSEGEGGVFGIGKNAPFAASRLRTVLYSTKTVDGDVAFQGVSTLASHRLPDGSIAQPTGFLGEANGKSIRSTGDIPPEFQRIEPGLDITVLEYPRREGWQNDLLYSVLDNFWPSIHFGDLTVAVGDQHVDGSNLEELLQAFGSQEDFTAHLFYRAYRAPSQLFCESLPVLKDCSLALLAGDDNLPRRVAMVRKTGMVVYQRRHLRSLMPFCGVFVCRNDEGNRVLREMEPPRHDAWDPDYPEKGANKTVEVEYMTFIRDCIRKLAPADDSKVIAVPDLSRFLPDDDDTDEESFGDSNSSSVTEIVDRSPLPERICGRSIDPWRQSMQPGRSEPEGGEDETEGGQGNGSGGGPGRGTNETDGGTGSGGGGRGEGNATPSSGVQGGVHSKPAVPIRYRTYAVTSDRGRYTLLVARDGMGDEAAYLLISTVGDDQKAPAGISHARLAGEADIPIVGPGMLGPVRLSGDATLRIEVRLSDPIRVAMEVTAHEA
jgi:hypothetical protein